MSELAVLRYPAATDPAGPRADLDQAVIATRVGADTLAFLDLRLDDEHACVHGEGGTVRTVLLDDRGHVAPPQTLEGRLLAVTDTDGNV